MAAISSNTDVALTNTRILWSSTNAWVGGVVPTIADDVTITSTRTTINQSSIGKWSGTITITVASTSGFPSTGYFYTYTDKGDYVKVLYTGTTATTFTGCSIDYTDPFCNWKYSTVVQNLPTNYYNYGSVIGNGYYVYAPAPSITIPAGYQANVSTLIISNGGILNLEPGANLGANNWITVRDGRFIGRANVGNVSTVMVNRLEASGYGYLQTENYAMSILDVNGGETRAYATVNTAISVGDAIININPVQYSFAVGDEVAIYDTSYANTRVSYYPFRDVVNDWRLVRDEGFDVAGVVGNQIALARRNGARAKIKSSRTVGSQKVLTVDKDSFINQLNFKSGDIVVINNVKYTLDSVKESDYVLGTYNFQTGSTLSDFLTDYATNTGGWAIDAYGAYATSTGWSTIVHKQFFRREAIIEAEISPLTQYTTGTRGTDQFGLLFNYDPAFRNATRNPQDGTMTGRFSGKDAGTTPYLTLASKYSYPGTDNWIDLSINPTFRTTMQGPHTERIEIRNGIIKAFINGEQVGERFDESGSHRGLFGWYAWNNTSVRVKSFTIRAVTQDLYITTTDTFNIDDTVYESGAEYAHTAGQRIIKIASKVTSPGTHDDLMFNYRGLYSANSWPLPIQYNGTSTSNYLWNAGTHSFQYAHEVYVDLGTTANGSITIDLAQTQTFTHVSVTPRMDDTGTNFTGFKGVQIQGSNNNSTWTVLYGPTDDVKRYANPFSDTYPWYQQMGHYYTGPQTYRYVKFIFNGNTGSVNTTLNRIINLGVYNFDSNNYTIVVNNASDFANGDVITVMGHANYMCTDDYHHYQAVKAGLNPDTYMYTSNTHSTIVNKVGNTLYLDRPINYGYVEGRESVVKINRNFKMLGYYDVTGGTKFQKPYFKVNQGTNFCQIRQLRNWQFYNVGSSRISASSWYRGVDIGNQDYWNPTVVEGISVIGYNNNDANGLSFQNGHGIMRNGYVGNVRDYRPYYSSNSRQGVATYNMKMTNLFRFRPESNQNKITNYNEVAGARQWDVTNVYDCDFFTSPVPVEFRRNNLHGVYQIPAFSPGSGSLAGDSTGQVIKNEYNILYSASQSIFNNGVTQESWAPIGMDIHADHPGTRLSWQRNESFIGWYNTAGDNSMPLYLLKDYMRADYDYCAVVYQPFIRRSGTDYVRNYMRTDDSLSPRMQFSLYSKASVAFQVYIEFEYRMPYKLDRLGASAVNYSKLYIEAAQNGDWITGYSPLTLPIPADAGWVKYSTTITFNAVPGAAMVCIGGRAMQQTVDFRYGRAYVKTNNPESIITLGNTFDVNKYHNITNDVKHMMPLSATSNLFKGVKF